MQSMCERARTPSELQYSDPLAGRVLRSNVPRSASFDRGAEQGTRDQPKDSGKVAEARDCRSMYESLNSVHGRGAAVTNLSRNASFSLSQINTPSHSGTEHLGDMIDHLRRHIGLTG
ncbi:MAG: hypothetical protein ABJX32_04860, partial [Tateyamaria sp.]|uniref:hypothetical protein n=1 Tax=Tateyamaria sp. TaxID=1929288 RepID=UPI00329C81A1